MENETPVIDNMEDESESELTAEDLKDDKLSQLGEMIQGASYMVGKTAGREDGLKEAIALLDTEAANLFIQRADGYADFVRKLTDKVRAVLLKVNSSKSEAYGQEHYAKTERLAFDELDRRDEEAQKTKNPAKSELNSDS